MDQVLDQILIFVRKIEKDDVRLFTGNTDDFGFQIHILSVDRSEKMDPIPFEDGSSGF